jgi:serine/threonine protein kinase
MVNSLPIGTIIRGRFLIQDQLSNSGFGNIYLVRDQRNTRNNANLFVLKEVINPNRHKLYQITIDGMALRLLRHEALPRVYNVLSDAKYDRVYVLMDYIEGLSLEMLRLHQPGKRFSFPQAMIIMEPVLSAVAYLHSQQPPVIHQDIKPASIIVPSTRDKVVLVDFGVGKKYNLGLTTTSARHSLTPYEAPEQYDGEIDTRSDIYGLGATFYTLLTGIVPNDALYRASKSVDSLEPMYQLVPAISMHVADAIHHAMSLSGNDRFASVQQFEQALKTDPTWIQSPKVDLRRMFDLAPNDSPALQRPPDPLNQQSLPSNIVPTVPANQALPASPMSPIDQELPVSHDTLAEAPDQQPPAPDVGPLALVEHLPKKSDVEPLTPSQPETATPEQVGLEPIIGASAYSQLEADSSEQELFEPGIEQESLEPVVEPSVSLQPEPDSSSQEWSEPIIEPSVAAQVEAATPEQESPEAVAEPSISSESEAETPQQVSSEPPLEPLTVTSQPTAPEQAVPDPAGAFIPVASSTAASLPIQPRKARSRKRGVLLPISIALLVGVIISIGLGAVFLSSLVYHGSRPATPTVALLHQTITPRPTSASTPVPSSTTSATFNSSYNGTIFDIPANVKTEMSLTGLQQSQDTISGYFTGLQLSGSLTGTVNNSRHIQFTVLDSAGHPILSFDGAMQSGGSLSGNYCRLNQARQCSGDYGLWSVVPASAGQFSFIFSPGTRAVSPVPQRSHVV